MKLHKTYDRIYQKLVDAFSPSLLEIVDESQKHAGHVGSRPQGETHFKVRIVSQRFVGTSRIVRHRAVYAALENDMQEGGIHALTLEVLTPDELSPSSFSRERMRPTDV